MYGMCAVRIGGGAMTGAGTCFTIFLDLHSSARPAYATFVESVASGMPPHGCRVRLSAYGACAIGAAPKLLLGRYVTTGDELRRQWQSFAKAPISVPIKRLDATLIAIFKADDSETSARRVGFLVSSGNWATALFLSAIRPVCASGVEMQVVNPNNASAVLSLMRSCGGAETPVQSRDLIAFNNHVVNSLFHFQKEIDVSHFLQPVSKGGCAWSEKELGERFNDLVWNNPLLFHLDKGFGVKTSRLDATGEIIRAYIVNSNFTISPECYRERRKKVEQAAAIALKAIVGVPNVVEKVKRLHDYLSTNCQYCMAAYGRKTMEYRTVYDALVRGQAVCEGFTIAFRYLLSLAGIESSEIVSDVMHHCWNYVRLGGNWYHVDVTFDNPVVEGVTAGTPKYMSHEFFLLSDAALLAKGKHHDWKRLNLPPATDTRFDRVKWE